MLIIFDFDGTLISASWQGMFEAYTAIIKHIGKNPEEFFKNLDEFKKLLSIDWRKNFKKLGIKDKKTELKCNKLFYQVYNPYVFLFPWLGDVLSHLSEKKHKLAILSNGLTEYIISSLGEYGKYFCDIVGGDIVQNLKPNPEGVFYILNKYDFPKEKVWLIGDTIEDLAAAKAAGVKGGAVLWGLEETRVLIKYPNDFIFASPFDFYLFCKFFK